MRRTKRGRFWHAGLLFLAYACIHVYSDKVQSPAGSEGAKHETGEGVAEVLLKTNEKSTSTAAAPTFNKDLLEISPTNETLLATTEPTTSPAQNHVHPTWRPKRTNCSPPAIEQFPRPLMGPNIRKHGGLSNNFCFIGQIKIRIINRLI